jgi:hypothetical protein
MEFDRLKCSPNVLSKSSHSLIDDDDEVYIIISDEQLLSHLVGDVSETGLDETLLVHAMNYKHRIESLDLHL